MAQQNDPPEQDERPRPHGDPLDDVVDQNPNENQAQAESDAAPDAFDQVHGGRMEVSDRAGGRGSDANGLPAFDEADGETRKKLYREGAVLVSKID
jgi:hypothetical protein